jgi:hypothetical protein
MGGKHRLWYLEPPLPRMHVFTEVLTLVGLQFVDVCELGKRNQKRSINGELQVGVLPGT